MATGRSPPKPHTHLGAGEGEWVPLYPTAGQPQPHGSAHPSPCHTRPPAAPSPAPQGKLRHDAKERRSLSPPNPDAGPGPRTTPMSWVAGQQPRWPPWALWDSLQPEGTGHTVPKQPPQPRVERLNPLVSSWQRRGGSALLLPTATGAGRPSWIAGPGFCSLPSSAAGLGSSSPASLPALPSRAHFQPRLDPPVQGPGAVPTSKRAARWS